MRDTSGAGGTPPVPPNAASTTRDRIAQAAAPSKPVPPRPDDEAIGP